MKSTKINSKKIGVLTFHCAHNYGAVLQGYALQEKLKELGNEVEFIDYRPDYLLAPYKIFSLKEIFSGKPPAIARKLSAAIFGFQSNINRRNKFDNFIHSKLSTSSPISSNIPTDYDLYIMGSDQIWNHNISNGFDGVFFGNFKTKPKAKKISYAASFGSAKVDKEAAKQLSHHLKNLDGISLREKEAVSIVQPLTDKSVANVLDPSLIVERDVWDKIIQRPNIDTRYVLVYQVHKDNQTLRIAHEIAKQLDAVVVDIPAYVTTKGILNKQTVASPTEFLSWIKYAECVVTTSFHGTAFSVIFNKPFYSINLSNGLEKRASDLLGKVGLADRLIDKNSTIKFEEIDFKSANQKLKALQQESIAFLKQYLD